MKVAFTCDRGHHLTTLSRPDPENCGWPLEFKRYVIPNCPVCSKLSYGPLMEEMVAEALHDAEARGGSAGDPDWRAMARFVLRLIKAIHLIERPYGEAPADIREWLLDLASEE